MTNDERDRALAGECISRAAVDAAAADATACSLDAIRAAVEACDHELAATRAIGRARSGHDVPVAVISEIVPGIEWPGIATSLIAIATGDRGALIEPLERRRFPVTREAGDIEAIVLYAAWKAGAPTARVIPELRRLAARSLAAEGLALIATIAAAIDDPNVAAATKPIATFAKEYAKQVAADDRAITADLATVMAALPAELETVRATGFTVRAATPVGRNDPCPCGSGLKYKKCCADKPVATPSPIPGLSWDEFLGSGADRMTVDHVADLALRDLARVDLARLGVKPLAHACSRFVYAHQWRHAARAIDALASRDPAAADDARDELVTIALDCGERALARDHVAKLPAELAKTFELELAIAGDPEAAWPVLVRTARAAVASADKIPDLELAYALLRAEPALGIVAARACIGTLHVDDADLLLELVEDARDRLNLPPGDPAWDVLDELSVDTKPDKQSNEAAALRASLHESAARADELERSLAAMHAQLDAERTRPIAELQRAPEERDRVAALDTKVRELEARIREGNAERRDLRRQLQAETARDTSRDRPAPEPAPDPEDTLADDVPLGARPLAIPRFERRAIDALAEVPAQVAAEAMRTVGNLAAGDGFAWRGVKQARDMAQPVLMARVGIHHRLVFRSDGGQLDVVDLITREQLMTTLKRLRSSR
jgi:hypothetical protein